MEDPPGLSPAVARRAVVGRRGTAGDRLTAISDPARSSRLARLLPPTRAQRTYALSTLINSTGTGLYTTGSVVFFVHMLHLSAGFIGAGLTAARLAGLLASLPAGRLADRIHAKRIVVVILMIQAALFALFPLARGRVAFLAIVVAVALAQTTNTPARQVLLADIAGERSRVAMSAYNRSVLNVGVSIGALLAAAALAFDSRTAYNLMLLGNALSFLIAGALLSRVQVPARAPAPPDAPARAWQSRDRHPLLQPRLVAAATICGILYLSAVILDIALPLQVAQHSRAPQWVIGFLLLINTILAVTLQVPASRGADTVSGASRANRIAGLALLGACLVFPLSSHGSAPIAVAVLIVATVLLTAGELFSSAGSWGLSYGLAPKGQQGRYLASFGLLSQLVQVAGPVLAAFVVSSGVFAWVGLGLAFVLSGLVAPAVTGRD